MIKLYKIMFFNSMMIGTLMTISSTSWMGMWLGLEINLLSIIPLMSNNNNSLSNEASLKYFITQAIASTIILFSLIFMSFNLFFFMDSNIFIMNSALLTKLGMAPFHFWFPEVMEGLSWNNCMIMLTWQKIAPMILLFYNFNSLLFFTFIILISMLISNTMGLNQISLRKILTYSSINHMAWLMSSIFLNESIWLLYFLIYSLISINIILMFKILNLFYLKQLFNSINKNFILKFFFIMNFLSLGGIPPFIGFFPKWIIIQNLIYMNFFWMTFFMILLTLITMYFYTRLMFSTLIIFSNQINYSIKNNLNIYYISLTNCLSLLSLIFISILFNF